MDRGRPHVTQTTFFGRHILEDKLENFMHRLSVMVAPTARERIGQRSIVIPLIHQVAEISKRYSLDPNDFMNLVLYERGIITRRIFRHLADALDASEADRSPSRGGLPEDDVADELLATVPPERARTASRRRAQEANTDDIRLSVS